jgi:hypothetical protein
MVGMKRPDLSIAIARGKARVKAGEGVLYVAEWRDKNTIKVGHTIDLERRIKELGIHREYVRLLGSFPAPIEVERAFHKRMRPFQIEGEVYPRAVLTEDAAA